MRALKCRSRRCIWKTSLNSAKLAQLERLSTEDLIASRGWDRAIALNQAGRNYNRRAPWDSRPRPARCESRAGCSARRLRKRNFEMATRLHWVEGPWPGKLALVATSLGKRLARR